MKKNLIPFARPVLGKEEKTSALNVLNGHTLTHGKNCLDFENNFANLHKSTSAVTLSNCTSAMFLALKSIGIGRGDEVIVPAMTHIATAHSVAHTGAKVVFADIDNTTGNINCAEIEKKITQRTKAIIVVHFIGLPAEMNEILSIIRKKHIFLIEDCAAALGATYKNKLVGTLGNVGCFSFYPTKHITTMEGGMLISKNKKFVEKIRKLSTFGYTKSMNKRKIPGIYNVDELGYNFRMSEVAAAIGLRQLKKLRSFLMKRKSNAKIIRDNLSKIKKIYVLPEVSKNSTSSNFCVNIIIRKGGRELRNRMIRSLNIKNIGTSVHYPICLPNSKFYKNLYSIDNKNYPVADYFASNSISLPCGPHIDNNDAKLIATAVKESVRELL